MASLFHLEYKTANGGGVPSPVDGPSVTTWPLDRWASILPTLAAGGVTVPVLPPACKGASLGAGYDPFDVWDLGSKIQSGRRQTRYGSREQLQRFCANVYRNGMEPAAHLVHHHVDGANNGPRNYLYLGADGRTFNGRFQKDANCFWTEGLQNPDRVPDPEWDLPFGDEFRWLSGTFGDGLGLNGPGYVGRNLIDATKWQLRTTGCRQIFLDDLKGTSANYIAWLCNTLWQLGLVDFCFGEYFEGARDILNNYINSYPIKGTTGCLDFSIRFALQDWCNSPGNYDMRQLLWNGLFWINPTKAVTFTDDADTVGSEPMWRVLQATAAICTLPGYPLLFGQYCYEPAVSGFGLMAEVMNLCWIGTKFRNGNIVVRAAAPNYLIYEYPQTPGLLVALGNKPGNFNNPADWTPVTIQTAWWGGTHLHDYTGHSNDTWVGNNGEVTIWIPPVDNSGRAYVCFSQYGANGAATLPERICRQTFYAAGDIDTPPATAAGTRTTHIWCDANKLITLAQDEGDVDCSVEDEAGNTIITRGNWAGETKARGWYRITAYSKTAAATPYSVAASYWGTKDLLPTEFGDPLELRAAEQISISGMLGYGARASAKTASELPTFTETIAGTAPSGKRIKIGPPIHAEAGQSIQIKKINGVDTLHFFVEGDLEPDKVVAASAGDFGILVENDGISEEAYEIEVTVG